MVFLRGDALFVFQWEHVLSIMDGSRMSSVS